jgi:hypothetical protein
MSERNRRNRQNARNRAKAKAEKKAQRERDRREIIGTVLFEVPWFLLDAFWLWPLSRVASLWAACFGIAVAFYRHVPSFDIAVRLIAGVALMGMLIQPQLPPTEGENEGWLLPSNEPSPPHASCTHAPSDAVFLYFGEGAYSFMPASILHKTVVRIGNHDLLSFDRNDNGVQISAEIFDENGILAEIKNRHFVVYQKGLSNMSTPMSTRWSYTTDGIARGSQ